MEKIKLEILGLSSGQAQSNSFALLLGEVGGNRRLPIIIGMFEAQAIAIEIEKIVPNRPMTHDLFKSFATGFNFDVESILISGLKEGVFFAKIICSDGVKQMEIDARPSDAVAIGLRFNVDIYSYESILAEAGIVISNNDEPEVKSSARSSIKGEKESELSQQTAKREPMKDASIEKLQELLDIALSNEDYEKAAIIRDELNKRN